MKEKIKNQKGITLVELVVTVIVLMVLAGITLTLILGKSGILNKAQYAKEVSTNAKTETEEGLNNLYNEITVATNEQTIPVSNGKWNGIINTPKIEGTGLIAVYWNGTEWTKLTQDSSQDEWAKWYDYSNQKWANAESIDGSMWVWIPRYEYKINSSTHEIDVNFKQIGDITTIGYILQPAFSADIDNGGWDSEISGFWMAKYVAGFQNSTTGEPAKTVEYYTTGGGSQIQYPVFKANTNGYNLISAGDAYVISQKIASANMYGLKNIDSHLQKNSEWGAVVYLTQSMYGRNGIEVNANNKRVTGYGSSNIPNDVTASSTNNMTGVFDLSGCLWEYAAGYFKGGSASTPSWHNAMASSSTTSSTKYVTLYMANDKKGDATNETSGWNSDTFNFVNYSNPIFYRGGSLSWKAGEFGLTLWRRYSR